MATFVRFPGALEGRYEPVEELGAGAFGVVYRARDRELGRDVAIKVLARKVEGNVRGRFQREARALAALSDPHVLKLFDFEVDADPPYLVTEFLDGLPASEAEVAAPLEVMGDVARGLAALHERGLVHRDVKPANIMVTREGQGVLLDLGLVNAPGDATALTRTGALVGTPHYLAPELFRGAAHSPASDWFAWGASLFFLLEGVGLREGVTLQELVARRFRATPTFTRTPAGSPAARLVLRCLADDPRERPRDAVEVLRSLADAARPRAGESRSTLALRGRGPPVAGGPSLAAPPPGAAAGEGPAGVGARWLPLGVALVVGVLAGLGWRVPAPQERVPGSSVEAAPDPSPDLESAGPEDPDPARATSPSSFVESLGLPEPSPEERARRKAWHAERERARAEGKRVRAALVAAWDDLLAKIEPLGVPEGEKVSDAAEFGEALRDRSVLGPAGLPETLAAWERFVAAWEAWLERPGEGITQADFLTTEAGLLGPTRLAGQLGKLERSLRDGPPEVAGELAPGLRALTAAVLRSSSAVFSERRRFDPVYKAVFDLLHLLWLLQPGSRDDMAERFVEHFQAKVLLAYPRIRGSRLEGPVLARILAARVPDPRRVRVPWLEDPVVLALLLQRVRQDPTLVETLLDGVGDLGARELDAAPGLRAWVDAACAARPGDVPPCSRLTPGAPPPGRSPAR